MWCKVQRVSIKLLGVAGFTYVGIRVWCDPLHRPRLLRSKFRHLGVAGFTYVNKFNLLIILLNSRKRWFRKYKNNFGTKQNTWRKRNNI